MSNDKESDRVDSHAIDRFENLVLELNRAVFQFGLFLPPLVMWEKAFRRLNIDETKYALELLQVIYNHVHHPELLFSNYYVASEQWERIQKHDPEYDAPSMVIDPLGDMFKHNFKIMDKPIYVQSAFYYNGGARLKELMKLYVDYLDNLRNSLDSIAREEHCIRIEEEFRPIKKIDVYWGLKELELVADFLIGEECIESDSKAGFLALFGNAFMKNDTAVRWIKRADSHATNVTFLKEVFEVMGVDMEDKFNRKTVESCFCGIDGKQLTIPTMGKRRKRSKELEDFSSRLNKVLYN